MDNEIILILTILACLLVLALIIAVLVLSRRKERTDYGSFKMPASAAGSFEEQLKILLDQWKTAEALKLVSNTKNIGLKEAKEYINRFMRGEEPGGYKLQSDEETTPVPKDLDGKVLVLLLKRQKIEAVKLVRETKNISLKDAKEYVEVIEKNVKV